MPKVKRSERRKKQQPFINVLLDTDTGDPDDVMSLLFLCAHPAVRLRAVTVTPGTDGQVGAIRHVLKLCRHEEIPVGSARPGYKKKSVSSFYRDWLGSFSISRPDDEGYKIIENTLRRYPDLTVVTGAPLLNFEKVDSSIEIRHWVAQGGFAGDNVVPEQHRLPQFSGKLTSPTFNFNGAPQVALQMLENPNIRRRTLVSKNVCHGMIYDNEVHEQVSAVRDVHPGLEWIWKGMNIYLQRHPSGKKLHDPLAACAVLEPNVCEFRQVQVYRDGGEWGANLLEGSNTWISISANRDAFIQTFTCQQDS